MDATNRTTQDEDEAALPAKPFAQRFALQRARIAELRQKELRAEDPMEALLGCDIADNASLKLGLMQVMTPVLERGVSSVEELSAMVPLYKVVNRVSSHLQAATVLYHAHKRHRENMDKVSKQLPDTRANDADSDPLLRWSANQ